MLMIVIKTWKQVCHSISNDIESCMGILTLQSNVFQHRKYLPNYDDIFLRDRGSVHEEDLATLSIWVPQNKT